MSNDCLFCRIVAGEIPAREVVRTAFGVAFHDLNPQAPTHVLVVPTVHLANAAAADSEEGERIAGRTVRLAAQVAEQLGLVKSGYRLVMNVGSDGGQSVAHLHVHLLGGRRMTWPPG
ncbi:MAG TPA: histidine triad nucleotide-binding protein [Gemmatimonadales bacterium]|jgi:histidine triad (HIT) family protein|nr:histidine triad nucleotide-binding protein [Gemmatimonadales bacterium]